MDEKTIKELCFRYQIEKYTIHQDELGYYIDVDGDVYLTGRNIKNILPIRFGKVSGNFSCARNYIKTLVGSPTWVGGYFKCSYNKLKSLFGSPKYVGGNFDCSNNELTSLEYITPNVIICDIWGNNIKLPEGYYPLFEAGSDVQDDPTGNILRMKRKWQIDQIQKYNE